MKYVFTVENFNSWPQKAHSLSNTGSRIAEHVLEVANLTFLFIYLLSENHKAGSAMGKSQLHGTNNMLDEFDVFLIQL